MNYHCCITADDNTFLLSHQYDDNIPRGHAVTQSVTMTCQSHNCWPVILTLNRSLLSPSVCVCDSRRGPGIRWWVPWNPIHLQTESRDVRMHSCEWYRHRCPDCRHHCQLWVRHLPVLKRKVILSVSHSTEISWSCNYLNNVSLCSPQKPWMAMQDVCDTEKLHLTWVSF